MTPDELADREAIRHTMAVYNTCGDRGRLAELAETFTPDGTLTTPHDRFVGRDAIREGLGGRPVSGPRPATTFVRHHLTTSRIDLAGEDARCWTYFLVFSDTGVDHTGTYVDRFRKQDDGSWLIAERRVKVHWDSPTTILHAPV
jgi:ketosteroid isomerase-like protein